MDHERVAALHDGRLGPRERDELLNELLANDDEYELFAETAAVLRELEEAGASAPPAGAAPSAPPARAPDAGDGVIPLASRRPAEPAAGTGAERDAVPVRDEGVIPLAPRRPGRTRWMAYGALAAGLAGLALAAALLANRGSGRLDNAASAVAMLEGGAGRGLPAGMERPWRVPRSDDQRVLSEPAVAVRLGATLVDLELATATRDTAVLHLTADVLSLLSQIDGSGAVAYFYREANQRAAAREGGIESLIRQGRARIRDLFATTEWLELGVWAETARIAAARRDEDFFRSRDSRAALERIGALPGIDRPLAAVREVLPADGRIDWPPNDQRWTTLALRLTALLRAAGR